MVSGVPSVLLIPYTDRNMMHNLIPGSRFKGTPLQVSDVHPIPIKSVEKLREKLKACVCHALMKARGVVTGI